MTVVEHGHGGILRDACRDGPKDPRAERTNSRPRELQWWCRRCARLVAVGAQRPRRTLRRILSRHRSFRRDRSNRRVVLPGRRRCATTIPGLSTLAGSNACLTAAYRSSASGEYVEGNSSLRARPSPCSPDNDAPYSATEAPAAGRNSRKTVVPPGLSSGRLIRMCRHTSLKCPYGSPVTPKSFISESNTRR